ncbi:MAG: 2,3-bisphosphoglycerate-independent phosphoglycerate mutase [Bacteroidia bacterium]
MEKPKVFLMIWDGWGIAEDPSLSAIDAACTPFYDALRARYPMGRLQASGHAVGLPQGQMGNSEVGHLHIGAGHVVWQELERIRHALEDPMFQKNPIFQNLISYCHAHKKPLHLMGLVSDGGVHSHLSHVVLFLRQLRNVFHQPIYVHGFTDGRDTSPTSGRGFLRQLEAALGSQGRLVSIIGRYYAMDRDKRWERVEKAYRLLVEGEGEVFSSAEEAMDAAYSRGETDEFLLPKVIGSPVSIQPGDAVVFFNFRPDRARQLTYVLTQAPLGAMHPLPLHFVSFTEYDPRYEGVKVLFERLQIQEPIGEVIARAGLRQIRIAETEKYPHVTYFLNGGREEVFPGEERILIPSPKVATYDLKPEMSAYEVTQALLPKLEAGYADFICLNFANPDMVGHTGVWEAAIRACEVVDTCSAQLVEVALKNAYTVVIVADHGNADKMRQPDGSPHTAHTTAPVPFFVLGAAPIKYALEGTLPQVGPTVLRLLGLEPPKKMLPPLLN